MAVQGLFSIFDITSAGMSVEQARLAATASNIANSRTTKTADGQVFQSSTLVVRSSAAPAEFDRAMIGGVDVNALPRPSVVGMTMSNVPPRLVYNPGHPDADARGFVAMPGIDPVSSMLDLISISRSYEANIRAFDVTRNLIQRTLDMGRTR
jgi:flagellar basal-body rod protein FlgC